MKLSTRGRYATRALLDIALHQEEGPVRLKDIAERQRISLQYLEHLVTPLIAGGIVSSVRGPRGGVLLARPPEKITLCEVIQLVEGPIAPVECVTDPSVCDRSRICVTRAVWGEMKTAIEKILTSNTIRDLMERQQQAKEPESAITSLLER